MDLKRRSATITTISEAYHTAGAIARHVDGRLGAHYVNPKCFVKQSSDNIRHCISNNYNHSSSSSIDIRSVETMHKFTNPLMVVREKTNFASEASGNSHHVVLNAVPAASRPIDDFFLLDFSATTAAIPSSTQVTSSVEVKGESSSLSSILVVGKKLTTTTTTTTAASSTSPLANATKRKAMPLSPIYAVDDGPTTHQLKVSAVPLSLNNSSSRSKIEGRKGCDDLQGFDKHDSEDGSTLADFLNLLSPDPGFESACGGDCSPPPVDLSALDGLSLDFPLNGCCNGDTGYGSSSSLGGGSPPSAGSNSSALQPGVEPETPFRGSGVYGDHPVSKKPPQLLGQPRLQQQQQHHQQQQHQQQQCGLKRKLGYNSGEAGHFAAKKSFTELSPKRPNSGNSVSVSLDVAFHNFAPSDFRSDHKTGFPVSPMNEKSDPEKAAGKFKLNGGLHSTEVA